MNVSIKRGNASRVVGTIVALAAIASIVGCGSPARSTATSPTASPEASNSASPSVSPALRAALEWVVEELNGEAMTLTADEVKTRFAPSLLAIISAEELILSLQEMVIAAPYRLVDMIPLADPNQAQGRVSSQLATFDVTIAVDPADPNLITGMLLMPASSPTPTATWDEIDAALALFAPQHSIYAAEIAGDSLEPIYASNAGQPLAIGSAFKLFVLGELNRQISAGTASWDEQLAIRDEWKSIPSGTMQDDRAGTKHSLYQYANQMIDISDNTATDHLIHRLGRQNVEASLAAMGMADPSRDIPLPTTREMSLLKATKYAGLRAQYLAADSAGRRKLLDGYIATAPFSVADLADWTTPRDIDKLEWFAGTRDLCSAMAYLRDQSTQPGLARTLDILAGGASILTIDKTIWQYAGSKGGSEPGVANLTWLLHRADGRWFVVSLTMNNPTTDMGIRPIVSLAGDAISLLGVAP